jgi:hypothetical protein
MEHVVDVALRERWPGSSPEHPGIVATGRALRKMALAAAIRW